MYVYGLDLSHWNWRPTLGDELESFYDRGYRWVYIKVSEGTTFVDPHWAEIKAVAESIGYFTGPYHWMKPTLNGASQAQHFHNVANGAQWHMKPMLDVEESYNNKIVYAARTRNCLNEISQLFGEMAIVYTSKSRWEQYVDTYVAEELFVAHWTTRPQPLIPRQWEGRGWKVWQYGIFENLDNDRYNGDLADFLQWVGQPPPPPNGDLEARVLTLEQEAEVLEEDFQEIDDWIKSYER
jgi:lysozyme